MRAAASDLTRTAARTAAGRTRMGRSAPGSAVAAPPKPIAYARLCGLALAAALFVAVIAPASRCEAREDLGFGGTGASKKAPFLSPDGSFAVQVPGFWQPRDFAAARVVEFRIPGPGDAWLQVRRTDVAPGTAPKQLLLRASEDRLAKLPHFREVGRRDLGLGGSPAAILIGDFWFQGNAEYPRTVEELFIVSGTEAFEMHFECFSPMVEALRPELMQFYGSFVAHPASRPPPLTAPAAKDTDSYFDRLPF